MNATPSDSRPWFRRVNFWVLLVTIAVVIPMGFVASKMQAEYSHAREAFKHLETRVSAKSKLVEEKDALLKQLQDRAVLMKGKIERAEQALHKFHFSEVEQFPVKSG